MRTCGPAVLLLPCLVACSEQGTAPAGDARLMNANAQYFEEGDQQPPPEVPPEYQLPTFIHSIEPAAGWRDEYAWAQGIVTYTATNVSMTVKVTTNADEETSDPKAHYQILPAPNQIIHDVNTHMGACGGVIRASVFAEVWNELPFLKLAAWGKKSDARTGYADCPKTLKRESVTVFAGGTNDVTCYELDIDHYWYYPATGELDFRYTETLSWCADQSGWET